MNSSAAYNPPSARGRSRWEITPVNWLAIICTAIGPSSASKFANRSNVSTTEAQCIVEITKCPVSAACNAVIAVTAARISPRKTTSGLCRSTARSARSKPAESCPISRCEIWQRTGVNNYSIGSSNVTTCRLMCWFNQSMHAATVVDFPEPVGPVIRINPLRRIIHDCNNASGNPSDR